MKRSKKSLLQSPLENLIIKKKRRSAVCYSKKLCDDVAEVLSFSQTRASCRVCETFDRDAV